MRNLIEQFLHKKIKQHRLTPIGNVAPVCPYCMRTLEKKPGRKKSGPSVASLYTSEQGL